MKNKKILFLLGHMPKLVNDGHTLNAYLTIHEMVKLHDCYIVGNFENTSFLHSIPELKNRIFNLQRNTSKILYFKSLLTFTPLISLKFSLKCNIQFINQLIQKETIDLVHSINFPATCKLTHDLNASRKVMTFPDLYSKYYRLLLKSKPRLKYIFNFISFLRIEKEYGNDYHSAHFVNYKEVQEANVKNAVNIPLLLPNPQHINQKKQCILLSRSNTQNTIWFLKKVVNKLPDYEFKIISDSKQVINFVNKNRKKLRNIELHTWINDYNTFINSIQLHVILDNYGTGQSNKVIQAFQNGIIVIGSELSFRGLKNIPKEIKFVYKNENDLVSLITEKINLTIKKKEQLKYIGNIYVEKRFNNKRTLELINTSYL